MTENTNNIIGCVLKVWKLYTNFSKNCLRRYITNRLNLDGNLLRAIPIISIFVTLLTALPTSTQSPIGSVRFFKYMLQGCKWGAGEDVRPSRAADSKGQQNKRQN
jgi:hypothetical protein